MIPATRRRAIVRNNGVMAGSVWETRMKMDEVKGGIKVFNDAVESPNDEDGLRVYRRLRKNQSDGIDLEKKKRKSWKQIEPQRSPIQIKKAHSIGNGYQKEADDKRMLLICDGQGNKEMQEREKNLEDQRRSFVDKEMDLPVKKEKVEVMKKIEEIHQIDVSPPPIVVDEIMASYVEDLKDRDSDLVDLSQEEEEGEEGREEEGISLEARSQSSNRMQHIVDLVMWRDISKTTFAFGIGTFFLISSSYAKDLNFSLISVMSYLGLLYLALIFVLRSIIRSCRVDEAGEFHEGDGSCVVGEEEAIRILRRILPYINDLLLRTRALFSGDPATTMKMAVFLFVMGRCGSSISLWTLVKFAFFGVFTVPKFLSSYSSQLGRYGIFWIEKFKDGWVSCTHKKAIVAAIFTLIWNLSSTIARVWAVFMLIVAIQLYQRSLKNIFNKDVPIKQNQYHHQNIMRSSSLRKEKKEG